MDYIKCELIGGGSPRHSTFFIVAMYYTHQYMLCTFSIVECTTCCPLQNNQNIPCHSLFTAPM